MANPRPNMSGLKRTAGPGRPKGGKNKLTLEMERFLASAVYQASAKERILDGKAPHLEGYWLNKINGKPAELHEIMGEGGGPIRVTFVDVDV